MRILVCLSYLFAAIGLFLLLFAGRVISWCHRKRGEPLKAAAVDLVRRSLLALVPRKGK
jgi:hypothetical protein